MKVHFCAITGKGHKWVSDLSRPVLDTNPPIVPVKCKRCRTLGTEFGGHYQEVRLELK